MFGRVSTISDVRREVRYGPTVHGMLDMLRRFGAEDSGDLPAHAGMGGYPMLYIDGHGDILCASCANSGLDSIAEWPEDAPTDGAVYWEGPDETCAECGAVIPSAYGDPDAPES